jgi:hypothetical protein
MDAQFDATEMVCPGGSCTSGPFALQTGPSVTIDRVLLLREQALQELRPCISLIQYLGDCLCDHLMSVGIRMHVLCGTGIELVLDGCLQGR